MDQLFQLPHYVVEKEVLSGPSSPQLVSGTQSHVLLHLVYESKPSNKRLLQSRQPSTSRALPAVTILAAQQNRISVMWRLRFPKFTPR